MDPLTISAAGSEVVGAPLTLRVDRSQPVVVIEVAGELGLENASRLFAVGLKELAEEPVGLVLDVGGMRLGEKLGLTVISALARRAERDRGIRVVLSGVSPAIHQRLCRLGMRSFIDVFDSTDAARDALRKDWRCREFAVRLPSTAHACRQARYIVDHACALWRLDHLSADAQLIASELVANAVVHAEPVIEFQIVREVPYLHIRVADGSRKEPVLIGPARAQLGGRGVVLIDALSTSWGHRFTPTGKVVWATIGTKE
jgi:anti-anti-sigma factor